MRKYIGALSLFGLGLLAGYSFARMTPRKEVPARETQRDMSLVIPPEAFQQTNSVVSLDTPEFRILKKEWDKQLLQNLTKN